MGDFEVDTRLEPIDSDESTTRLRAVLSSDWQIWGPNGGYVAAIALRAAGHAARVDRPATFSGHFLAVADFEAVDVEVRTVRAGKRSESFAVSITQNGRPILEALVRTAAEIEGLEHDVAEMPDVRAPGDLTPIEDLVPDDAEPPFPFWNNFDVRPVWPERFATPERAPHDPIFLEWFRYRPRRTFDDVWVDAARSLLMIDTASWIAASQPHVQDEYSAPNIDVNVWFHQAEPESDWLLIDQDCPVARGGLMGTHGRIWSESGRLLASGGAQLYCLKRRSV